MKKKTTKESPFFEDIYKILDDKEYYQKQIVQKMEEVSELLKKNKVKTELEAIFKTKNWNHRFSWRF